MDQFVTFRKQVYSVFSENWLSVSCYSYPTQEQMANMLSPPLFLKEIADSSFNCKKTGRQKMLRQWLVIWLSYAVE